MRILVISCLLFSAITLQALKSETGYFQCSEIYWSSQSYDLELSGNPIIVRYLDNQFKGKGTAIFLENEKAIFLNGQLLENDKKTAVEGYQCNIKRIDREVVLKKYGTKAPNGGIDIQLIPLRPESKLRQPKKDSLTIYGSFSWKDNSITGYPSKVKIIATEKSNQAIIKEVDSLGRFQSTLPFGKYTVAPALNYHWVGEELIRIDEKESNFQFEVKANGEKNLNISLDTIAWPVNDQKTGLLNTTGKIDVQLIDKFIKERMAFFEIPGVTLSIIKDNQVIYSQIYGVKNAITKEQVTNKTLFEAGSITKLVFAFATMRLYEKGILDLDKPLYEYLESEEINDDRYKIMTARHVLSHQSGMKNWPRKDANGQFKLNFKPGTQFGYSGKAFEYLKLVLETITSKSIDEILEEEVLKPLELSDMHFKGNDEIAENGANGHKKYVPSDIFLARRTMVAYTLQTTSEALAKFTLTLQERKGLKKETYDEMFKVHSERADGTQWGLGVRIEDTPAGRSYGHSGSTGRGFISNLVFYNESGLGYTILTNTQMGGWLSLPLLNEFLILGKQK